tara:strand:- start:10 stop:237 length:228 start_codon:yes stop_codon:yes gene_type:complete
MESTIKKYTNLKGVSHDAHFNARGKYIGSVKKLGPAPIKLVSNRVQELELENKQLREHIAKIQEQMANLYVINLE